jgi:hypothetical protein
MVCYTESALESLLLFLLLLITFILNLPSVIIIIITVIERCLYNTYYMACIQSH